MWQFYNCLWAIGYKSPIKVFNNNIQIAHKQIIKLPHRENVNLGCCFAFLFKSKLAFTFRPLHGRIAKTCPDVASGESRCDCINYKPPDINLMIYDTHIHNRIQDITHQHTHHTRHIKLAIVFIKKKKKNGQDDGWLVVGW
jgi:hypothetical protein